MKQLYWNYLDRFGKKYQIGLYHGATGHLVIYCNNAVLVIDFNVQQNKEYSFFIGEELIELSITKANEAQFDYDCQINKKAPTMRNLAREKAMKQERKHNFWAAGMLLTLIFLVYLVI